MSLELSKEALLSVASNAVAAGVSAVNTNIFDMSGYDAISFHTKLNTVVDGCVLQVTAYSNTVSSTAGGTAVQNGATPTFTASGSSNTIMVCDVIRPKNRYVFATVSRTAQNATIDSIVAMQYRAKNLPVTQGAQVISQALGGPEA